MFAVELLANSAVVCIVTLCFQKQPPEVLKWLNNFFSESNKNFCRLISYERLKYAFPLDFDKYLSCFEVQKNSKVDIRKEEVCSKSVKKTFYGSKFLVSEYIFKLVNHCEGSR